MASPKDDGKKKRGGRPATTPEGRENQIVGKAVALAEHQIEQGTASAQVISHYLKLGSTREKLEQEKMESENALLRARVEQLESQQRSEDLYTKALDAFRAYSGQEDDPDYED